MKLLKNFGLLMLMSILVFSSCKKDDDIDPIPTPTSTTIPEELITSSLNGTVINEAGLPLEFATVKVGTHITETDPNGVFSFNNIKMNKNGALILVEKDGYFKNTKVVLVNVNKTSITKLMLIEKVVTATFDVSTGGTTTMNGGAKVDIPADGIKLENGGAYSGNVNVYATWLDPTASDLNLKMPGDLRARNTDEETVKLVTYGMIGVELEGENGEPLNIADGQTATIELPVPASLLPSAPATIPLWHFDEATGYWVQEGEATLSSNNTYVGTVSHFSFWNCDIPEYYVHIEGYITNEGQFDVSGLFIEITENSSGMAGYAYTDNDGWYGGYVPKDMELTLKVFDNCGDEIHSTPIGPFSEDTDLPNISVSNSSANFLTVVGVLQDCDNNIVSDGYAQVNFNGVGEIISVADNGNFNGTISICDAMSVSVSGVSLNPFSQGTTTVHDVTGISELNVGTLITCW